MMNPLDAVDMVRRRGGSRCIEIGRHIQTHLDGGLDGDAARRVEDHLDACRRCGLAADDYRRIKAALAERAPLPVAPMERLRRLAAELAETAPPER